MLRDADDRVTVNRRAGELTISFGGDTNQATQFARSVPDFALKGRFADLVKLDLSALEQELGFAIGRPRGLVAAAGRAVRVAIGNSGVAVQRREGVAHHSLPLK